MNQFFGLLLACWWQTKTYIIDFIVAEIETAEEAHSAQRVGAEFADAVRAQVDDTQHRVASEYSLRIIADGVVRRVHRDQTTQIGEISGHKPRQFVVGHIQRLQTLQTFENAFEREIYNQ